MSLSLGGYSVSGMYVKIVKKVTHPVTYNRTSLLVWFYFYVGCYGF
jgi:hypothetical protein